MEALSYIHDHIAKSQKLDDENFKKITIEQQKIAIQTNKDLAKAQKEQAKAIKEQTEELKRKDNIANQQLIEDRRKNDYNAEVARQNKIFEPERQNLKRTIYQLSAEIEQLKSTLLKQSTKQDECINELTTLQKKLNQIEVNIIQHCQNKTGESLINAIHEEFTAIKNSTHTNEPKVNEKNETDDAAECPICLEHIAQNNDYFKTTCKHVFHKHCLREYKIKAGSNFCCPLCRGAITNLN